jgi:hypothetical protein
MRIRFRDRALIQLHRQRAAAALLRALMVARVRQEMFKRSKQKRPKPPLHRIGASVGAAFD